MNYQDIFIWLIVFKIFKKLGRRKLLIEGIIIEVESYMGFLKKIIQLRVLFKKYYFILYLICCSYYYIKV